MYSEKRQFGNLGEDIVCRNLISKGFSLLDRNYLKKWGEIDIVARETDSKVHFIEVKTVSHDTWRPEENVHPNKLQKLHRVIESWLLEKNYNGEWQIDVAIVTLDTAQKKASIRYIENVT